jgi:hypothetical protein
MDLRNSLGPFLHADQITAPARSFLLVHRHFLPIPLASGVKPAGSFAFAFATYIALNATLGQSTLNLHRTLLTFCSAGAVSRGILAGTQRRT